MAGMVFLYQSILNLKMVPAIKARAPRYEVPKE